MPCKNGRGYSEPNSTPLLCVRVGAGQGAMVYSEARGCRPRSLPASVRFREVKHTAPVSERRARSRASTASRRMHRGLFVRTCFGVRRTPYVRTKQARTRTREYLMRRRIEMEFARLLINTCPVYNSTLRSSEAHLELQAENARFQRTVCTQNRPF